MTSTFRLDAGDIVVEPPGSHAGQHLLTRARARRRALAIDDEQRRTACVLGRMAEQVGPIGNPHDGRRPVLTWLCFGRARVVSSGPAPAVVSTDDVETFLDPVDGSMLLEVDTGA